MSHTHATESEQSFQLRSHRNVSAKCGTSARCQSAITRSTAREVAEGRAAARLRAGGRGALERLTGAGRSPAHAFLATLP
jgi:hypothetical protein